jgi:hypothetical protein
MKNFKRILNISILSTSLVASSLLANPSQQTLSSRNKSGQQADIATYFVETAKESKAISSAMHSSLRESSANFSDAPIILNVDQQYLNYQAAAEVELPESNPDEVLQVNDDYFQDLFSLNEQLNRIRKKTKDRRTGKKLQALVEKGLFEINRSYKLSEMFIRMSIGRCIDMHYKTVRIDNGDIQQTANNHYQFMNDCYNFAVGLDNSRIDPKFPKVILSSKTLPNHKEAVEGDVSAYEKAFGNTKADIRLIYKSQAMYGYEFVTMLMKNYATDKTPQAKALWLMRSIAFYTRDLVDDLRVHNNYLKRALYYVAELQQESSYQSLLHYFANGGQGLSNHSLMQITAELYYQFREVLVESKPYIMAIDQISTRDLQSLEKIPESLY